MAKKTSPHPPEKKKNIITIVIIHQNERGGGRICFWKWRHGSFFTPFTCTIVLHVLLLNETIDSRKSLLRTYQLDGPLIAAIQNTWIKCQNRVFSLSLVLLFFFIYLYIRRWRRYNPVESGNNRQWNIKCTLAEAKVLSVQCFHYYKCSWVLSNKDKWTSSSKASSSSSFLNFGMRWRVEGISPTPVK